MLDQIDRKSCLFLAALGLSLMLPGLAGPAVAETYPSSDVLVPYFEVALQPAPGLNTLFSICNDSDDPVDVLISVNTNWGIPVLLIPHTLQGDEVHTVNLYDWLVNGRLFDRVLTPEELSHIQAALSGKPSPQDGKWYGTEIVPGRAVGYVTIRTTGAKRPDVLWGDYFLVDPSAECFQGETLANIDHNQCDAPCERHGIRFLNGGAFEDGTELIIWTEKRWAPSPTPEPLYEEGVKVRGLAYDEPGLMLARRDLSLLPVEVVNVSELTLPEPFGWLDLSTDEPSFITGRFTATLNHTSSALHSYCLPDEAPGPTFPVGTALQWTFAVTNTGNVKLSGVTVTDDSGLAVTCPKTKLEPGESMTCTAGSTAVAGDHANVAVAKGKPPCGPDATASDPVYIRVPPNAPGIDLEKLTNGEDADAEPGPSIELGAPVQWTYRVTNTGNVALSGVAVTDDRGVAVTCPKTTLAPGESMDCTGSGVAQACQYGNLGTVTATEAVAPRRPASDQDASHYFGQVRPALTLVKLTEGSDGPELIAGDPVHWTYTATNTGNVALTGVAVSDDQGVAVSCPKTTLQPGESMTCTAQGTVVAGQYRNLGTVTGKPLCGPDVTASDGSSYTGLTPGIALEKLVNGDDSDQSCLKVRVGSPVLWTYVVTNTGNVGLTGLTVTDDQDLTVTCPKSELVPGESVTCMARGTAESGTHQNVGTATAQGNGKTVTATDPACYLGETVAISLEKLVNGQDADVAPGVSVAVGATLQWTYLVTNTGEATLRNVTVTDDQGLTPACPKTELAVGESMTCTATSTAALGQHHNVGTATGTPDGGTPVSATDPAWYVGVGAGNQGCTPGYWKNHTDSWPPTGYSPSQSVASVFAAAGTRFPDLAVADLLRALSFSGGPGDEGAAEILLRAAVAALLNASHPGVAYPRTPASVLTDANLALAGTRDQMLTMAAVLDADNNRGCPLN